MENTRNFWIDTECLVSVYHSLSFTLLRGRRGFSSVHRKILVWCLQRGGLSPWHHHVPTSTWDFRWWQTNEMNETSFLTFPGKIPENTIDDNFLWYMRQLLRYRKETMRNLTNTEQPLADMEIWFELFDAERDLGCQIVTIWRSNSHDTSKISTVRL